MQQEETESGAEEKNALKVQGSRIVIDGEEIAKAAENMNGLTFKGFGVLDCNSTNALLWTTRLSIQKSTGKCWRCFLVEMHPLCNTLKLRWEMTKILLPALSLVLCVMRTNIQM